MLRQELKEERNAEGEFELQERFKEIKARSRSQRIVRRQTIQQYSPTAEEKRSQEIDVKRRVKLFEKEEQEQERIEKERRRNEERQLKGEGKGDKGKAKSRNVGNYTIT